MPSLSHALQAIQKQIGSEGTTAAVRRLLRVPAAVDALCDPNLLERALASKAPLSPRSLATELLGVNDFDPSGWSTPVQARLDELSEGSGRPSGSLVRRSQAAAELVRRSKAAADELFADIERNPGEFRSSLGLALPDLPASTGLPARLAQSANPAVRLALWNAYLAQGELDDLSERLRDDGIVIDRQLIEDLLASGDAAAAASVASALADAEPSPSAESTEGPLTHAISKLANQELSGAQESLEAAWDAATERTAHIADSMADLARQAGDPVLELEARQRALESRPTEIRRAALALATVHNQQPERALGALADGDTCPQSRIAAGHGYRLSGEDQRAEQAFREAKAAADELDANWLHSLVDGWVGLGQVGEAVALLDAGVARFPGHLPLRRQRAEWMLKSGQADEAAREAAVVVALDPDRASDKRLLAEAAQAADRPAEALPLWLELIDEDPDLRPQAAECALQAGELATALALSQALVDEDPESPQGRVALGKSLLAAGNARAGQVHLRRATELGPGQAEPWLALAQTQLEQGDVEAAGETLTAAAQACPQEASVHAHQARWLAEQELWTEAAEAIARARDLEPENPDFMASQGQWLLHLGRMEEAEAVLEEALARKPGALSARTTLAEAYEARHAYDLAAELLAEIPDAAPPSVHALAARIWLQLPAEIAAKRAEQALVRLQHAEDSGLDRPDLPYWRGQAHHLLGQFDDAIQAYQRCLKALPEGHAELSEACLRGEAEAALASEQVPMAISVLERARNAGQAGPTTLALLSSAYSKAGLTDEALSPAIEACQAAPEDPAIQTRFLEAARDAGDLQLALTKLDLWTSQPQVEPTLFLHKAEVHAELGQREAARRSIAQALWRGRRETEILHRAADSLSRIGQAASAKRLLQTAVDRSPDDPALLAALGRAAESAGDPLTARRVWLRLLEIDPESIEALQGAAAAHWRLDQRTAAIGCLQRAVAQAPHRGDLQAKLARAQLNNGEVQRALEHFRLAASKSPDNRDVTLEAAQALLANGAAEEAQQILEPLARLAVQDGETVAVSAEAYLEMGLPEKALTVLRRIPEPDQTARHRSLFALAQAACGRSEEAVEALHAALKASPVSNHDQAWVAQAALQLGHWAEASTIAKALRDTDDPEAALMGIMVACRVADAHALLNRRAGANVHAPADTTIGEGEIQGCLESIGRLALPEAEAEALQARVSLAFNPEPAPEDLYDVGSLPRHRQLREQAVEGMALAQLQAGDPDGALRTMAQSLRTGPSSRWGALLAGVAHLEADRAPLARKALGASDVDPVLRPVAAYFSAESWATEARWAEAINNLNTAVIEWPEEGRWHQQLAQYYLEDGRPEASLPHLQQALEIDPQDGENRLALARALHRAGHLTEADQAYAQVIDQVEASSEVLLEAANVALQTGEPARASSIYERVLAERPKDTASRVGAAKAALAAGDKRSAEKHAAVALRNSPQEPAVLMALGEVCAQQGQHRQALELYERARRHGKASDELERARGRLLVEMGRGGEAIESLRRLAETAGEDDRNWAALAQAFQATGQIGQAIDALRMARRLQPGSGEYRIRLASLYRQAGQLDQALSELTELGNDEQKDYRIPLELGLVHKARRQYRQALQSFERAIQLHGSSPAAHFQAGMVLKSLKAYARAAQMLARAVELNPNDSEALHQLAAVQALELVHGGMTSTAVTP